MSNKGMLSAKFLARNPDASPYFINSIALLDDGRYLIQFTEQPGDDEELQMHTLAAIGNNMRVLLPQDELSNSVENEIMPAKDKYKEASGTSFSAPITSAAAALVVSHLKKKLPNLSDPHAIAVKALLKSAQPIILVPLAENERGSWGSPKDTEMPVIFTGIRDCNLIPDKIYKIEWNRVSKFIWLSRDMIRASRKRCGMGRLYVPAALLLADELAAAVSSKAQP